MQPTEQPLSPAERSPRSELLGKGLLALFLVVALASLPWLVHPWYDATNDGSLYILTARSLAAGDGYSYLGEPFIVRPPGFSALLAPLIALRGTDFAAFNVLTSVCGVLALAFLFEFVRRRIGVAAALALVVCLWLNPAWQRWSNQTLSDMPGLLAGFACLALERWASKPHAGARSLARDGVLGVAIGLAALVRTVNVMLVPAVVLASAWKRDASARPPTWKRALLVGGGALLVLGAWAVRDASHPPDLPVDQNYLHSQWTNLLHVDGADPSSARRPLSVFVERLPARVEQLLALLGSRMEHRPKGSAAWNELALGAFVLGAALVQIARRRGALELFAALAILPLLFFQAFLDRHVLPVYALAWAFAIEALLDGLERLNVRRAFASAFAALVLAALTLVDLRLHDGWDLIRQRDERLHGFARELAPRLQPNERVASYLGWHLSVHLERPVWSLMFAVQKVGAPGIDAQLSKYAIDTVVLADFLPADRELQPQLEARATSVERVEHGLIARLK